MAILETLKPQFHVNIPPFASSKYIHFLMLRHSQSFPVFQTDGILNTTRTQAGLNTPDFIARIVMFKRKQVSPERLIGRELLRSINLIDGEDKKADNFCRYGGEQFCGKCPDCVIYGFAVGDSGSERSKVYSDSAFSLTPYQDSRKSFSFNALGEAGTMILDYDDQKRTEDKKTRTSINEQEHILPEIVFPTVETLRDPTFEGFIYVLGNLLRTRRYGAQESRTGKMTNHILGIAFCDGEIFSNLHFTQAIYDQLKPDIHAPISDILTRATEVADNLIKKEPVRKSQVILRPQLDELLTEVSGIYQDETRLRETLTTLYQQTKSYAETYGALTTKEKGKNKGKSSS